MCKSDNTIVKEPFDKITPGKQWDQIKLKMEKYDETGNKRFKEDAATLLWQLGVQDLIGIARRRGVNLKDYSWNNPNNPNNPNNARHEMIDFSQSVMSSFMTDASIGTLIKKHQEKKYVKELSFRTWMWKRMEWKMLSRLRKKSMARHVPARDDLLPENTIPEHQAHDPYENGMFSEQETYADNEICLAADDWEAVHEEIAFESLLKTVKLDDTELAVLALYVQGYTAEEAARMMDPPITAKRYQHDIGYIMKKFRIAAEKEESEIAAKEGTDDSDPYPVFPENVCVYVS